MAESIPQHLQALSERYQVERELGRGGMATVYLALDLKLQRQVALKVLRPELAASLGPERFLREIAIAARLSHPNMLSLHDSGEAGGHLYYAMPYVEGASLRQRLEREGQLPLAEAIAIVQGVASALTYAHHQGVIHRDIKPENILLASDPSGGSAHPLVADFGLARALDAAGGERLTETGLALGTPSYMSPEQAASGRLDGRTDIYALGCVAYEMLAGQPPFTGPTAQAVLARHAVDPLPSLRTVRGTIPPAVEAAIARALAKVPADRFATAEQFAQALTAEHGRTLSYRRHFMSRSRAALVLGVGALAVATGMTLLRGSSSAVVPLATRMAVLPFAAGADTGLTRLGRDLAVTISASLDGLGGIETADRHRITQETAGNSVLSVEQAANVARRVGASSLLRGTLVRTGDRVRLDAGVYATEGLAPLAEGITVTAHRDSIGSLTDSTAWTLLRQIWKRGDPPSPSLAAITTRSIPALRAFLDGEREIENNRWEAASLAFSSAIAADSTFRLAYFRYALATSWNEREVEPDILDALRRHRNDFPERDRLLVNAWVIDSLPQEVRLLREVTRRFPDYWPGWFLLGDRLYHSGSLYGYDLKESQTAFGRAVTLNHRLKPAWLHLLGFNLRSDSIESDRALSRVVELPLSNPAGSDAAAREMSWNQVLRLMNALAHHDGVIGSETSALADSIAHTWASLEATPARRGMAPWNLLWFGFPIAQVDLNQKALRSGVRLRHPGSLFRGIAWAWAERGAWDSALAAIHEAATAEPHPQDPAPPTPVDEYGMAVLGAWLGVLDPERAISRRGAASATVTAFGDEERQTEFRATLAWLDGVLAFAQRDRRALEQARQRLGQTGHARADRIDRSLAAFGKALAGDRAAAGRELARLEWHCAIVCRADEEFVTPNIAIHRIAAATWLLEAGDTAQAARLLNWHEATVAFWPWSFTYAVTPLAYLMLARIEKGQHRTGAAREHYHQFLRRYDSPMPDQQHLVNEARTALASLSGTDSSESR